MLSRKNRHVFRRVIAFESRVSDSIQTKIQTINLLCWTNVIGETRSLKHSRVGGGRKGRGGKGRVIRLAIPKGSSTPKDTNRTEMDLFGQLAASRLPTFHGGGAWGAETDAPTSASSFPHSQSPPLAIVHGLG